MLTFLTFLFPGTFVCCTCENYKERPGASKIIESLTAYYKTKESEEAKGGATNECRTKLILTPKSENNTNTSSTPVSEDYNGAQKEEKTPSKTTDGGPCIDENSDGLFKTPLKGEEREKKTTKLH